MPEEKRADELAAKSEGLMERIKKADTILYKLLMALRAEGMNGTIRVKRLGK